jgi:hypothetical protein
MSCYYNLIAIIAMHRHERSSSKVYNSGIAKAIIPGIGSGRDDSESSYNFIIGPRAE